jgi:hypothetical protein
LKRSVKLLAILITKSISGNLQNSPGENDMHLKARIFAVVLILVSIGLIYYNWHQLLQEREYSVLQIHKFFVFWQVFKQPKEPDQFGGTLKRLP